jgi:hypothetical protein
METTDIGIDSPFWLFGVTSGGPSWNRRPSNAGTATQVLRRVVVGAAL